jgi:ABC-type multidrug transport system permease subunit
MKSTIKVFGWLLWRDVRLLRHNLPGKLLDALIWSTNYIIINSYIMPLFGVPESYGPFIWVGAIVTMGFFDASHYAADLVNDIAGDKSIEYLLMLPVSSWLIFIKIALSFALNCMALSIFILPLGKLLLWNRLDLSNFSIIKFVPVFILANLFFGFFALWIASWARDGINFSYVWRRIVNPLWIFGGNQFSWAIFYKALPSFALLGLLNPVTYAFEGMRSAILGEAGFLNIWVACGMLIFFTFLFGWWALTWMKRRLDYV